MAELDAYFRKHVLVPGGYFRCEYGAECRRRACRGRFVDGHLHHVGAHYDLFVDRLPLPVMVFGQD